MGIFLKAFFVFLHNITPKKIVIGYNFNIDKMKNWIVVIVILLLGKVVVFSQDTTRHQLIQFSGVVVSGDSLEPVPYCTVLDKSSKRGTISDYFGYFSFVAHKGDSIRFSSVGFKTSYYVIPDTLKEDRYSLIHVLTTDTIMLPVAVIYPWPSKEQFAEAFVNVEIPNDDYKRAVHNLAQAELKEMADGIPMNGSMNYNYQMQQVQNKLYYAGQLPPNNLLNPIAWSKFIQSWKNGDFKRQ